LIDPTLLMLTAVKDFWSFGDRQPILISSPPGLGKTALLSAVADTGGDSPERRIAWVSGSVVASEGHFAAILAKALDVLREPGRWEDRVRAIFSEVRSRYSERVVVILDDLDQLVFKRENLLSLLAEEFKRSTNVLLIATAKPMSVARLTTAGHSFESALTVIQLRLLGREAGIELIHLRSPDVPPDLAEELYDRAGGHPAALVFLARLVTLSHAFGAGRNLRGVWDRAAEFAGTVYAQQWYALGPQQRSILREIAASPGAESSPTELSGALLLQPSHVGAQLKRLENEALVERGDRRGRYRLAPLLAQWITERAVRTSTL